MSDAFTDCYSDIVYKNRDLFKDPLLKLFQYRSKRNKKKVIDLALSIDGEQIELRIRAFLYFANKLKRGRARLRRNSRIFKKAMDAFLNPEGILKSEGIQGAIVLHWKKKEKVLGICLARLKKNITYPGLDNETCVSIDRDEHVARAGKLALFLGKSKDAIEFLNAVSKLDLLMEK